MLLLIAIAFVAALNVGVWIALIVFGDRWTSGGQDARAYEERWPQ